MFFTVLGVVVGAAFAVMFIYAMIVFYVECGSINQGDGTKR